jgi:hypothetical protein
MRDHLYIEGKIGQEEQLLVLLYRYRFLTIKQLQQLLGQKQPYRVRQRIKVLVERQMVVQGSVVRFGVTTPMYSVTAKGAIWLRDRGLVTIDASTLQRIRRSGSLSAQFQEQCMLIADWVLRLLEHYQGVSPRISTQMDLASISPLPQPRPHLYVKITALDGHARRYFVEFFDVYARPFVIRQRLMVWYRFWSSGDWETQTNTPFPALLILVSNSADQMRIGHLLRDLDPQFRQVCRVSGNDHLSQSLIDSLLKY